MDVTPAGLAVFRALIEAILEEMGEALCHGAFSQNMKERRDYSCALFNHQGDLVAAASHIPVHIGSMDTACKAAIGAVNMRPGDAVILNDPFSGGTHLPDITIIFPVFFQQSQSADFFLGVRAHHSDVGGTAPGSLPVSTRLDEEGLVITPVLVMRQGILQNDVLNRIAFASRQPMERQGDLKAQLAAGAVGHRRLRELVSSRGVERVRLESSALIEHSTKVVTAFLASMPPGQTEGLAVMDSVEQVDGERREAGAEVRCSLRLYHEPAPGLVVDFSASSDQHPGCLNAVPAIVRSAVLYTLRLFLPEDTPVTGGLLRPIEIRLRPGSLLDPRPGAAVAGGNVETSQAIVEALLAALDRLGWDVPAQSQGTMNNVLTGSERSGSSFTFYETIGGGAGASRLRAGESGIQTHMTNTRNTPIEALERDYPLRIMSYGFRDGSGGDGEKRGGDGIVREYAALQHMRCTILSGHRETAPAGAHGGNPGREGRNVLLRDGLEIQLPARVSIELNPGDILRIETPGGGGWGKPYRAAPN